jgi:hypothetical protein
MKIFSSGFDFKKSTAIKIVIEKLNRINQGLIFFFWRI